MESHLLSTQSNHDLSGSLLPSTSGDWLAPSWHPLVTCPRWWWCLQKQNSLPPYTHLGVPQWFYLLHDSLPWWWCLLIVLAETKDSLTPYTLWVLSSQPFSVSINANGRHLISHSYQRYLTISNWIMPVYTSQFLPPLRPFLTLQFRQGWGCECTSRLRQHPPI